MDRRNFLGRCSISMLWGLLALFGRGRHRLPRTIDATHPEAPYVQVVGHDGKLVDRVVSVDTVERRATCHVVAGGRPATVQKLYARLRMADGRSVLAALGV